MTCTKCGKAIHVNDYGYWVCDILVDEVFSRCDHGPDVSVALAGHTAAALDHITGTPA